MGPLSLMGLLCLPLSARPALPGYEGSHLKGQGLFSHYPDDSLFRDALGSDTQDAGADFRLRLAGRRGRWDLRADYQVLGRWGDSLALPAPVGLSAAPGALPDDERRWMDLTGTVADGPRHKVVQRLDRLNVGYTGDKLVLRLGRQAVSWGNGLIFNPVDVFNPFDPAAVDTEYKVGDDMLYGQYLLDSGSDVQAVRVQRRDATGAVTGEVASTALKFHGFGLSREYDLLLAEHYGDTLLALGGSRNVGEAVLRGDLVAIDSAGEWVASAVVNWSWSWVWGAHNVSAVAEYYFNGFGLRESEYSARALGPDTALGQRLARGELFTVGRHYAAGTLQVELTPLLNLTPALFANLGDGSALLQLAARWDLAQNWQVLAALNLPLGPAGTEYGGLEVAPAGTLATGPSAFVQVGIYF